MRPENQLSPLGVVLLGAVVACGGDHAGTSGVDPDTTLDELTAIREAADDGVRRRSSTTAWSPLAISCGEVDSVRLPTVNWRPIAG